MNEGEFNYLASRVRKMEPVFIVSKRSSRDNSDYRSAAYVGGGVVATAGGLLGGGIPGTKPDIKQFERIKTAPTRPSKSKAAYESGRGGIFGFREQAHEKATRQMNRDYDDMKDWDLKSDPNATEARYKEFERSRRLGKIGPERSVIEHLKRGRKVSNVVAGAGLGSIAYGYGRSKKRNGRRTEPGVPLVKSDSAVERYNGGILGVGAATALGAHATERALSGQAARWNHKRKATEAEIDALTPHHKPVSYASRHITDRGNDLLRDMSHDDVARAGKLSGRRTQERYFANTYRANARVAGGLRYAGAGLAAVGAGGLYANRKKNKKQR